ncbi:potassium voltage-gated channel subfamily A member 10-like [Gigantopelta aegis]|uniref:potassium voltage-gated channel subfamily A member 10-like n=1 Tax=Gigantopelta aegis TaxID=1735272 RepID=UPI001B88B4AB|nr:potassium voltage-gated channel subfamily A member 10-like [Gigantopelta aegis]
MVTKCCWQTMCDVADDQEVQKTRGDGSDNNGVILSEKKSKYKTWRYQLCEFLEVPNSSRAARLFNLFMVLVITVSALAACLESLPQLRVKRDINPDNPALDEADQRAMRVLQQTIANTTNHKLRMLLGSFRNGGLYTTDLVCVAIFATDLIVRWFICPFKIRFFKKIINWIDVVTVVTGCGIYLLEHAYNNDWLPQTKVALYPYLFLRSLYVVRLFRFIRLSERFVGLKIMLLSVKQSLRELLLLFFTYQILAMVFGSLVYYCQFDNNQIANIPLAMWWAVVTMMTIGYGDFVPSNACGYVVGTICSFCGLIMIAIPLTVVSYKFSVLFSNNLVDQYIQRKFSMREKRIN